MSWTTLPVTTLGGLKAILFVADVGPVSVSYFTPTELWDLVDRGWLRVDRDYLVRLGPLAERWPGAYT